MLLSPWPWWFSGLVIATVMFLLIYFGKSFGFSSNLRTLCAMSGAGDKIPFFRFNWRGQFWNIIFLLGAVAGGFISGQFLSSGEPVKISEETIRDIQSLGFSAPEGMQPPELFSADSSLSVKGFLILSIGGLLVGFGSRYAGGCTSGHAISGLADLQWPSLIAVIGFFIGGLVMTHLLFPILF